MDNKQLMLLTENLVDASDLVSVVELLRDVCHEKADHLRSNWQDEHAAKRWEKAATVFNKLSLNGHLAAVASYR